MMFTCPVCFYDKLDEPARPYNICDCCGTEFGNDDDGTSYDELRSAWISRGAKWFFGQPPFAWSATPQLLKASVRLPNTTLGVFFGTHNGISQPKLVEFRKDDAPVQLALAS